MHENHTSTMAVAARFGVKLCLEAEFWGVFHPKESIGLMLVAPGVGLGVGPQ